MQQRYDPRNADILVNVNGELVHRDQARISPFDSAVQGGDAVWEGLRLYAGRIFRLNEHLDRLRGSALALAFAEIPSHEVGLAILGPLRELDEVAYLRFASVYRSFSCVEDFEKEIAGLRAAQVTGVARAGAGSDEAQSGSSDGGPPG